MPVEVIMPKVDMDMTTGTFAAWHVEEGRAVAKGEPLFDIETDKSAMEVDAPASGTLRHVLARPGERIAVGAPVAWIYAEGEAVGERQGAAPAPPSAPAAAPALAATPAAPPAVTGPAFDPAAEAQAAAQPAYGSSAASIPQGEAAAASVAAPAAARGVLPPERPRATPAARRLARENGVALGAVAGTGPRGRVQGADVADALAALAARAAPEPPATELRPAPAPAVARGAVLPDAGAPPPSWSAEGGDLHVSRRKGEGRPLLLIHGFAADSQGWAPFERELPRDASLLRIDLPSHGRSPRAHVDGFQALLRRVLRAFDAAVDGPVHLLGHSLGGAVALGLADIRPRQVASLTLLAPAGLGPEIDAAALAGIARASRAESLAPWLQRLTATPEGISWDFARAAMLARTDPELRAAQVDLVDALFPDGTQTFDLRAALGRVEAPTTIVWGRKDRIVPWRHALAARGETALHLMSGVGHIPHVERPAALAAIVSRARAAAGG